MQQLDFLQILEQPQVTCLVCGKDFEKKKSKHIYCSEKCGYNQYRIKNREKLKEWKKQYRIENREKIKEKNKQYYIKNREKLKEKHNQYKIENREKLKDIHKQYRIENKEKIKQYRIENREKKNKYEKKRKQIDFNYKLLQNLRTRMRTVLIKQKTTKSEKTLELLGCSLEEVRNYIQSQFKDGMTWENHGYKGWHIDHIIPCASFDLTDPEQQKKCFHYTNLQPLWWHENLSKGAKIQ